MKRYLLADLEVVTSTEKENKGIRQIGSNNGLPLRFFPFVPDSKCFQSSPGFADFT